MPGGDPFGLRRQRPGPVQVGDLERDRPEHVDEQQVSRACRVDRVESGVGEQFEEPFVQGEGVRAVHRAAEHQGDRTGVRGEPLAQLECHRLHPLPPRLATDPRRRRGRPRRAGARRSPRPRRPCRGSTCRPRWGRRRPWRRYPARTPRSGRPRRAGPTRRRGSRPRSVPAADRDGVPDWTGSIVMTSSLDFPLPQRTAVLHIVQNCTACRDGIQWDPRSSATGLRRTTGGPARGGRRRHSPRQRRCCPRRSTGRTSCASRAAWCCRRSPPAAPALVWTWFATAWTYAILAVPILLLPAVLGRRDDPALRAATYLGATSVVLSLIGFLRWVFVVPPLARLLRRRATPPPEPPSTPRGPPSTSSAARCSVNTSGQLLDHRLVGHPERDHPAQPGPPPLAGCRRARRQHRLPAQPGRHPGHRRARLPRLGPRRAARQHRLGTVGRRPRRHRSCCARSALPTGGDSAAQPSAPVGPPPRPHRASPAAAEELTTMSRAAAVRTDRSCAPG